MMDYPSLAALAAIIREGTFERAASAIGVTPSAISQRVRGLEERLGAILVIRANPCRPTDLGQRLCAHFEQVRLLEADLSPALPDTSLAAAQPVSLKIAVNADSLATWFPAAAATLGDGATLDIAIDDEAHTAERLRTGEVSAAVTADPSPVQGCRTIRLGVLAYLACASPDFARRHFGDGPDARSLATAPCLRFDRRDALQARWADAAHAVSLAAPTHFVPSTHGFLDMALAGLGWGMHPLSLVAPHLASGGLVELPPAHRLAVTLYWTVSRLPATSLDRLTRAVRHAARHGLTQEF